MNNTVLMTGLIWLFNVGACVNYQIIRSKMREFRAFVCSNTDTFTKKNKLKYKRFSI